MSQCDLAVHRNFIALSVVHNFFSSGSDVRRSPKETQRKLKNMTYEIRQMGNSVKSGKTCADDLPVYMFHMASILHCKDFPAPPQPLSVDWINEGII
jgi:hypothetical protein